MLAAQELSIDPKDVPPDLMDALAKMDKIRGTQVSVAFSINDLTVISQGLALLQRMVKHGIRDHGTDVPEAMIDMLGDARALEGRVDQLAKGVMDREFGPDFDADAVVAKIAALVGQAPEQHRHEAEAVSPGYGGQYL